MAIQIDGAIGEGGGQVLRTSLTLAMCTGQGVVINNIRAGRSRPGLLRQHLGAVRAARDVSSAEVDGAELGSTCIEFSPKAIRSGDYAFPIGSAGSATLLMQTILPVLGLAAGDSRVNVQGGTHNGMAPSVDFIDLAYLPQLHRMGFEVESTLERHGFYPNGGGSWHVKVAPWKRRTALCLVERGAPLKRCAIAKVSNLQRHIPERELERVSKRLGWTADELIVEEVSSAGPGNILSLRCTHEYVTEVFESVGARGISAERVAGRAIRSVKTYQAGTYPVGEYLADQLLVPMVLGSGGEFVTGPLTDHTLTNIRVIEQMLGHSPIQVCERSSSTHVRIPRGLALTC